MGEIYEKPMIEFIALQPEERLAGCLKCPGKGAGTPGGNQSLEPDGATSADCAAISHKS